MEKTAEAEAISDDLAFLYKGKLIFAEEKETLKKRYGFLTASDEELEKIPRSGLERHLPYGDWRQPAF